MTGEKRIYLNGTFRAAGEREGRGLIGETFNLCKKDGTLADLIVGFAISACEFADRSNTYSVDQIREQFSEATDRLLRFNNVLVEAELRQS